MSAAKMVADSTQGDLATDTTATSKRKKLHDKKKSKKQKKQMTKKSARRGSSENDQAEDDTDDLDLTKELQPISSYLKDRQEMMEQMFKCLKGPSLQRNLPDVLKDLPLEDLKQGCLNQLEIMSKKRIQRILAGDNPDSISSSGTDESSSEEDGQRGKDGETKENQESGELEEADSTSQPKDKDTDSLTDEDMVESEDNKEGQDEDDIEDDAEIEEGITEEETQEIEDEEEAEEGELREEEESRELEEEGQLRTTPTSEVSDTEAEMTEQEDPEGSTAQLSREKSGHHSDECSGQGKVDNSQKSQNLEPSSALAPVLTENQMELLELEMRARAIKAMLRAQETREKKLSQAK